MRGHAYRLSRECTGLTTVDTGWNVGAMSKNTMSFALPEAGIAVEKLIEATCRIPARFWKTYRIGHKPAVGRSGETKSAYGASPPRPHCT